MQYRKCGKNGPEVSILGYGCMRFPKKNGRYDMERTEKQVMSAIKRGVNYFDTAYVYFGNEVALGEVLAKNGVRNDVMIATKIPPYAVNNRKDMDRILNTQLERLKTDYIDYYLVHAVQDLTGWERSKKSGLMKFLEEKKENGVIKNIGFSYHGGKDDFKRIIDDYPWDFCQIQYNYIDENNQAGREGLRYAYSKGIGVIIMEPLRGGSLVGKMPKEIGKIWDKSKNKRSLSEWALTWLWDQPEVSVVLSGMNEEAHIDENINIANEVKVNSLSKEDLEIFDQVKKTYLNLMKVGCTSCEYCMPCPAGVNIPFCFSYYNTRHLFKSNWAMYQYHAFGGNITGGANSLASKCIGCGKCEKVCPQNIEIRKKLMEVKKDMEPWWSKPIIGILIMFLKIKKALTSKDEKNNV